MKIPTWLAKEIVSENPFEREYKGQKTTFQKLFQNYTFHDEEIIHISSPEHKCYLVITLGGPWNLCAIENEEVWKNKFIYLVLILNTYHIGPYFKDAIFIGRFDTKVLNEDQKDDILTLLNKYQMILERYLLESIENNICHTKFYADPEDQFSLIHDEDITVKLYDEDGIRYEVKRI